MDNSQIKKYILLLELPLDKAISLDDIKRAYRRLSKKYHPDTASVEYKDGKKFTELTRAKDYLIDNLDYVNRIIANGQINSTYSSSYSPFNIFDDNDDEFEDFDFSWFGTFYREQQRREAEERIKKEAEQKRREEAQRRHAEEARKRKAEEERKRREAEEKRRKEEYERRQREEAERKFQYSVKKTAILNDIKAFHSSLKKDDYFVNDYSQINEDIMTFTRNVNNNIYSNIEGLTNAYNNLINKIKSIKTISQVKAQKRRRNTIVSCLSGIAAVVVFVVLLFEIILPTINYNKAVDLLEQNKYEEAGEIFEDLDGFKDSNEQVIVIDNELKYQNAVKLLNNNNLMQAKELFVQLNGYRDSGEKINAIDLELNYLQALNYYNNKKFSSAKLYFEKTQGYKQTAEYYSSVLNELEYIEATSLFEKRKYSEAQQKFETLNGFRDSNFYAQYINALELESAKKYLEAKEIFIELGSFKDSVLKASSLSITIANSYSAIRTYLQNNKYNKAVSLAEEIGVSVSYSYNLNGTADSNNLEGYAKIPSKKGYTFTSWDTLSYALNTDEATLTLDLSAEYNIITYNISYVDVRGDYDSTPTTQYTIQESVTLPKIQHAGYIFLGWYENGNRIDNIIQGTIGDITLTAKYEAKQFTITYNFENGNLLETQTVTYNESIVLKDSTKKGYDFVCWKKDGTIFNKNVCDFTEDITLVAVYDVIHYSISYLNTKGEYDFTPTVNYTINDNVVLPNSTHPGYTFLGWYENGNRIDNIAQGTIGDITLTAKYEAKQFIISYDFKNGSYQESQLVTYGEEYSVPNPTRVGYSFAGWFNDDIEYEGGIWNATTDKVLVASWTPNKNISYKVNRHLQNVNDDNYTIDVTEELIGTADSSVTPEVKDYVGFTSPVAQIVNIVPDGTLVVDYYYTRNYYEISMVSNGGDKIDTIRKKYQSKLNVPTAIRNGYTFGGWYTEQTQLNAFESNTMPSESITLYAHWLEESKACDFTYAGTESYTITGYVGESNTMAIPSYIGGIAVVNIQSLAFENASITKAIVPESITEIGNAAFKGCCVLEDITLPFVGASETATAYDAVFGYIFGYTTAHSTSKKSSSKDDMFQCVEISVSDSNAVWQYSCYNYWLEYNSWSGNVYGLQSYAYYIPSTIKRVNITKQETLPVAAFNNCAQIKEIMIPKVKELAEYVFNSCVSLKRLSIGESATSIGSHAFANCSSLTDVILPNTMISIGSSAFANCINLKNLTIGNSVTSIGGYAFYNCSSLIDMVFPNSVIALPDSILSGCNSLESVTLPIDITKIGSNAFYNCSNLMSITIPNSVTSIGAGAFYNCSSLTRIVVPNFVTTLPAGLFSGCSSLESIALPFVGSSRSASSASSNTLFGYIFGTSPYTDGIETKQHYDDYHASYTNYYIPSSLTDVTITSGKILYGAFFNCSGLTRVTIGNAITEICDSAFNGCSSLMNLTLPFVGSSANEKWVSRKMQFGYIFGTTQYAGGIALTQSYSSTSTATYYIPANLKSLTIIGGDIYDSAFKGCTSLSQVTLGDSVTSIGSFAFSGCSNLTSIVIGESVTSIGNSAFYNCSSLTNVNYLATIEQWCEITFGDVHANPLYHAKNLYINEELVTELIIPNTITKINNYTFSGCSSLIRVIISNSVKSIGSYMFLGCTGIKEIYYSGTQEQWNEIIVGDGNDILSTATICYEYEIKEE